MRTDFYDARNTTLAENYGMSDPILLEINDGVALVTLNRPDKLNALNYELIDRLMSALDTIETDAACAP